MKAYFNPLVSFIVPCYNVEQYVEKCIRSITDQHYRNVEIILIEDGSSDSTGEILDHLAQEDNRIKVIHQENKGVSAARNSGLDVAIGDYIVFVDGDDYIALEYTDYMLSLIERNNADFALSLDCFMSKQQLQVTNELVSCLSPEDATTLLLGPRVIVGCWNKIYSRALLEEHNIRFITSQFYGEGLLFITTVSQRAKRVSVGDRKVYYYRRNNEASACTKFNINNFYNGASSIDVIEANLLIKTKKVKDMIAWHRCQFKMGTVVRIIEANLKKQYIDYYRENLKYVRRYTWRCILNPGVSLYKKGILLGTCISPKLMARLDVWRRYKIVKNSLAGKDV